MTGPDEYSVWITREKMGKNADAVEEFYDELIHKVQRIDPITIAQTADAHYRGGDGIPRLVIPFLTSWFTLDLLPYRLRAEHQEFDTVTMKVLVLQYLITAAENQGSAVKVMNQWIDPRSLQFGAILGAHFAKSTMELLDAFFSAGRDSVIARALKWGGRPNDFGDTGFTFYLFPRLPVALIHWNSDEEFPAYSKILYDVSASNYMPTHGLTALTDFLIHRLAED
ncbi:MAG: DUF3786 domain-containing protein [Desulfomonilaceae bacterium]